MTKLRALVCLAVLAVGVTGAVASARLPAAYRAQEDVPKFPRPLAKAVEEAHVWIGCLARQKPDLARQFLAAPAGSRAEWDLFEALNPDSQSYCARVLSIRIEMPFFRGALAEAAYENGNPAVPAATAAALSANPRGRLQWANATPRDQGRAGELIARCYAPQHPAAVHRLLETRPGSREERDGLRAIAPALASCLPDDQAALLNPILVRSSLAYALYQHTRQADASLELSRE